MTEPAYRQRLGAARRAFVRHPIVMTLLLLVFLLYTAKTIRFIIWVLTVNR